MMQNALCQSLQMHQISLRTLKCADDIKRVADHIKFATDTFYIGRGLDYTMSLEAALKLKEISYVHAEAYAAESSSMEQSR